MNYLTDWEYITYIQLATEYSNLICITFFNILTFATTLLLIIYLIKEWLYKKHHHTVRCEDVQAAGT